MRPDARYFLSLFCLGILVCSAAVADLTIILKDGREIAVPVDSEQIERIVFSPTTAGNAARLDAAAAPDTVTRPVGSRVWQVGPNRELKLPSQAAKKAKNPFE